MSPLHSSNAPSKPVSAVSCPQCGESVRWSEESAFRPFCSKRCRLIDLGEWIDERNTIPGEPAPWPDDNGQTDY